MTAICVADFREQARRRLPRLLFDYIDGGADCERTLARNTADLEAIALSQRVLRDVSAVRTQVELFGRSLAMPVALGPVGLAGMFARRGEVQAARAADAAGVPFCLSTMSICDMREVAAATTSPLWFQLYMIKDRGHMTVLLERAATAGVEILVFTVDVPVPGLRRRDFRSGMTGAPSVASALSRAWQGLSHPHWFADVFLRGRPHDFGNLMDAIVSTDGRRPADIQGWIGDNFDPSVTWDDLAWVRQHWRGPIVLKGILDPRDARTAVEVGVDGVIVSNHGGRQLDGVLSGVAALPAIVEAVGDTLPVLMDGGIRSGADVLKAMALGARACLLGRAWAYALGAAGGAGVASMLDILRRDLVRAMQLSGCTDIRQANRDMIAN